MEAVYAPDRPYVAARRGFQGASRSHVTSVAGAIAGVIRGHGRVELQAIGAGAVNQATKAIAIARNYWQRTGSTW